MNENNPSGHLPLVEYYLSEVFIRSDQEVAALICLHEDSLIRNARSYLCNGKYIVAILTKPHYNRMVYTFICEKIHTPEFCMG